MSIWFGRGIPSLLGEGIPQEVGYLKLTACGKRELSMTMVRSRKNQL